MILSPAELKRLAIQTKIREETRQVEPGGDGGEKEGTGLFGTCVGK